jgi:phosphoribosylformimino-5-aminoimidazole carboxamide ribotide isomerase
LLGLFDSFAVIPAIDLRAGKVVRLVQGDFAQATVYSDDPATTALEFERAGARAIHVVDLDGARAGKPCNLAAFKHIRAVVRCALEVSGGLRSMESIEAVFAAGADYVSLGSAVTLDRELVGSAARAWPGRVLGSLDSRAGKIAINGWEKTSALELEEAAGRLREAGVAAIILTDILRDGTERGVDASAVAVFASRASIPVIASGGVGSLADIRALSALSANGVAGVIIGRALYQRRFALSEAIAAAQDGQHHSTGRKLRSPTS